MEIKRLNQSGTSSIIFGATLDAVEKDEQHPDIPKFVVECIKVIEIEENMQTNGIYRASGKKDSIDKLRKRVKRIGLINLFRSNTHRFPLFLDERIQTKKRNEICISQRRRCSYDNGSAETVLPRTQNRTHTR